MFWFLAVFLFVGCLVQFSSIVSSRSSSSVVLSGCNLQVHASTCSNKTLANRNTNSGQHLLRCLTKKKTRQYLLCTPNAVDSHLVKIEGERQTNGRKGQSQFSLNSSLVLYLPTSQGEHSSASLQSSAVKRHMVRKH